MSKNPTQLMLLMLPVHDTSDHGIQEFFNDVYYPLCDEFSWVETSQVGDHVGPDVVAWEFIPDSLGNPGGALSLTRGVVRIEIERVSGSAVAEYPLADMWDVLTFVSGALAYGDTYWYADGINEAIESLTEDQS